MARRAAALCIAADRPQAIHEITTADVMGVLLADDFWNRKRVTARVVRQRIGAVMKWAVAQGYREDNPAGDAISAPLPKNVVRFRHQRVLPHGEVTAALTRVRASDALPSTKLALEMLVLTACRSDEVRMPRWPAFDLESGDLDDSGARRRAFAGRSLEAALAHVVKNQVEAAHARSDLLESRREVMERWSEYLNNRASDRR